MPDDRSRTRQILQRIADALGVEAAAFTAGRAEPRGAHETLELLRAFERIADPNDRRLCLDFVRSVAARQPLRPPVGG